ncbi:hypothetical protein [Vulcanisaeta distributa]|uniref:hypothetical protein n=1 Tax=Vulcanisaeta distributa TaxID=164451 RepID=UPI000AE3AEA1|nr:hypothetical protein [Vulcanisaeta distributa]
MASASAATPLAGYLLFNLGLRGMLIAITFAFILGVIPTLLFSEMGRQIPLTALVSPEKPLVMVLHRHYHYCIP